jgi:hypothetical protein
MKFFKALLILILCFSSTVSAFAGAGRLLTADTPFIDTTHILTLEALSYRPLDLRLNLPLGSGFAVSVNSSFPLYIVGLFNGGVKLGWDIPASPLAMSLSIRYLEFTGEKLLIDLINGQLAGAATIVSADFNFTSILFEGSFGIDLKPIHFYIILESQLLGNKTGWDSFLRPVLGADIQMDFVTFFLEAGYFIHMQQIAPVSSGSLIGLNTPGDLTLGGGICFDLKAVIITAGIAYPGFELKYGTGASDVFSLPILPYISLEIPLL